VNMMEVNELLDTLSHDEQLIVYSFANGAEIALCRTDKHAQGDFAIELTYPHEKTFRPTHTRLLIDLYIKCLSDKEKLWTSLLPAIEGVFAGICPKTYTDSLGSYPTQIDEPDIQLCYTQLMMAEHDFKFGPRGYRKAKILPPREYLMRFIRWAVSGEDVDRMMTSAVRNFPPPARYASRSSLIDCIVDVYRERNG
jgi:hypothetical protein